MRLVPIKTLSRTSIWALLAKGDVIDFSADPQLPKTMVEFVEQGQSALARAAVLHASCKALLAGEVDLLAPPRPRSNIMCIGKNYVEHAKEFASSGFNASQEQAVPSHPIVFSKAVSSIIGPGREIDVSADDTRTSNYEGQLGVVIRVGGTMISASDAWQHVYGYTAINDMTVRELQKRHVQFFIGKSAAAYCPMGPQIVTRDEIEDVTALWVSTRVNGEERQAAPVSDLIFSIPVLIEVISATVAPSRGTSSPPGHRPAWASVSTRRATWLPATRSRSPSRGLEHSPMWRCSQGLAE